MITNEQMNIEENHLKETYNTICNQIEKSSLVLQNAKNTLEEQLKYKDEDYYDMDEEERVSQDLLIKNLEDVIVVSNQKINILNNLKKSCYFGSVVFSSNNINKVYFGINSLLDENATFPLICDWRAPIASLFYNNELGKAVYSSKEGEVSGEIFEKRQFKVKEDNLVYAFDSNLTISDEILKQELGNAKSDKMTNIVATIQKEQNEIIRNTNLTSTIIQGVAGSGKTSIALHRAAFLLYNFRNQIRAENILVFSPADVFSKYIENVLPELGEEMVKSTTILNLAKEELLGYLYETAPEFFARLYNNQAAINDYIYRSGFEYVEDLKQFLKSNNFFEGADLKLGNETISATYLNNLYQEFNKVKSCFRIDNIISRICDEFSIPEAAKPRLYNLIYKMYKFKNIYEILIEFEKNNKKIKNKLKIQEDNKKIKLNYDIIPIILYLADYFFGLETRAEIKFLIIDEFQEYPIIMFELFKSLFNCNFLISGDIYQNIYKNLDISYVEKLSEFLEIKKVIYLNKSYRMTNQICLFAKQFKEIDFKNFDRSGKDVAFVSKQNLIKFLQTLKSGSMAIIFKDAIFAEKFYEENKEQINCTNSTFEEDKLLVTDYNLIKGLEFNDVIIADYDSYNLKNEVDKNILFNIATRATNSLYIEK